MARIHQRAGTPAQSRRLHGNNGWARNTQSEALRPSLFGQVEAAGLTLAQVKESMRSIGYSDASLHMLDRCESKRATGKIGV